MPKWQRTEDINKEGLYLALYNGDLVGNSSLTYIRYIEGSLYVNCWGTSGTIPNQLLNCPKNKYTLFFGPIPNP